MKEHPQNDGNKESCGLETPSNWELPQTFFKTMTHYESTTHSLDIADNEGRIYRENMPEGVTATNGLSTTQTDDSYMGDQVIQSLSEAHSLNTKVHSLNSEVKSQSRILHYNPNVFYVCFRYLVAVEGQMAQQSVHWPAFSWNHWFDTTVLCLRRLADVHSTY